MRRILPGICVLMMFSAAVFGQTGDRERGIDLYRTGNYADSITPLRKAIEADAKDKLSWIYLGASLYHAGEKEESVKAFKKAIGERSYEESVDVKFNITKRQRSEYTPEARENGITGTVWLAVEFRADGKIGFIIPVSKLSHGLTESAVRAVTRTQFTPAMKNGNPVSTIRLISSSFNIY